MNTALKTTDLICNTEGVRLDIYLSDSIDGLTRNAAQKLLEAGRVTLQSTIGVEAPVKKNHKTALGEVYTIIQDEPMAAVAVAQDIRLDIVFEDSDVIVVNKPQGMVVHPAPGHSDGTLVNALLHHCGNSLSGIGGVMRPGIVHRLDKDTSGLIIAAKNDKAHLSLTAQLSARTLTREYETIVHGKIKTDSGTIKTFIGRHKTDRKKQAVYLSCSIGSGGVRVRDAITHYNVLGRYHNYTHVQCRLETGRTHQIRVHLAHIGHPVLGDNVYGVRRLKNEFGMSGQCLHARALSFVHPSSGEMIKLSSQLPEYFTALLNKLGCVSNERS